MADPLDELFGDEEEKTQPDPLDELFGDKEEKTPSSDILPEGPDPLDALFGDTTPPSEYAPKQPHEAMENPAFEQRVANDREAFKEQDSRKATTIVDKTMNKPIREQVNTGNVLQDMEDNKEIERRNKRIATFGQIVKADPVEIQSAKTLAQVVESADPSHKAAIKHSYVQQLYEDRYKLANTAVKSALPIPASIEQINKIKDVALIVFDQFGIPEFSITKRVTPPLSPSDLHGNKDHVPDKIPGSYPFATNKQTGQQSNVVFKGMEVDGREYLIPTMQGGQPFKSDKEALDFAKAQGLEKYPSFTTKEAATKWAKENHGNILPDGTISHVDSLDATFMGKKEFQEKHEQKRLEKLNSGEKPEGSLYTKAYVEKEFGLSGGLYDNLVEAHIKNGLEPPTEPEIRDYKKYVSGETEETMFFEYLFGGVAGAVRPAAAIMVSRVGGIAGTALGVSAETGSFEGALNAVKIGQAYARGKSVKPEDLFWAGANTMIASAIGLPIGGLVGYTSVRLAGARASEIAKGLYDEFKNVHPSFKHITGVHVVNEAKRIMKDGITDSFDAAVHLAGSRMRQTGLTYLDEGVDVLGETRFPGGNSWTTPADEFNVGGSDGAGYYQTMRTRELIREGLAEGDPSVPFNNRTPDETHQIIVDALRAEREGFDDLPLAEKQEIIDRAKDLVKQLDADWHILHAQKINSLSTEHGLAGTEAGDRMIKLLEDIGFSGDLKGLDKNKYTDLINTLSKYVDDSGAGAGFREVIDRNLGASIYDNGDGLFFRNLFAIMADEHRIPKYGKAIYASEGEVTAINEMRAMASKSGKTGDDIVFNDPHLKVKHWETAEDMIQGRRGKTEFLPEKEAHKLEAEGRAFIIIDTPYHKMDRTKIPGMAKQMMEDFMKEAESRGLTDGIDSSMSHDFLLSVYNNVSHKTELSDVGTIVHGLLNGNFNPDKKLLTDIGRRIWVGKSMIEEHFNHHVAPLAKLYMRSGLAEDKEAFRRVLELNASLYSQVDDIVSHMARLVEFQKVNPNSLYQGKNVTQILYKAVSSESLSDSQVENIMRAAAQLDFTDPNSVHTFMRSLHTPSWGDIFEEIWFNSVLSGIATHSRNLLGNSFMLGQVELERMIRLISQTGSDVMTGNWAGAKINSKAIVGQFPTFGRSILDGFKMGWKAFQTEVPRFATSKYEEFAGSVSRGAGGGYKLPAITKGNIKIAGTEIWNTGRFVRTSSRALMAEDDLFKNIHYSMELHHAAWRKVRGIAMRNIERQGATNTAGETIVPLTGQQMDDLYKSLMINPTADMVTDAKNAALVGTFQKEMGKFGKGLNALRNATPGGRYIVPFLRTPMNITAETADRIPGVNLATAFSRYRASRVKGGMPFDWGVESSKFVASLALGYGILEMADDEGLAGMKLHGGYSTNPSIRAVEEVNFQQYSVEFMLGNKPVFIGFQNIEPLSGIMGIITDINSAYKEGRILGVGQAMQEVGWAFSRNISNKAFGQGFETLTTFFAPSERDSYLVAKQLGNTLTGFAFPSAFIRSVRDTLSYDEKGEYGKPNVYRQTTIMDAFHKIFPDSWWTKATGWVAPPGEGMNSLLMMQDIWGRAIVKEGLMDILREKYDIPDNLFTRFINYAVSPFQTRTNVHDNMLKGTPEMDALDEQWKTVNPPPAIGVPTSDNIQAVNELMIKLAKDPDPDNKLGNMSQPSRKMTVANVQWEMSREEYMEFRSREGRYKLKLILRHWNDLVQMEKAPNGRDMQRKLITDIGRHARAVVKQGMFASERIHIPPEPMAKLEKKGLTRQMLQSDLGLWLDEL